MTHLLNQEPQHDQSNQRLQRIYDAGLIVPEKKPFLIDLHRSSGPYLAVEDGQVICDGASQIASMGLGFNAAPLFGAAEYLESWINCHNSENVRAVRAAYQRLLRRKLGSHHFRAHFRASGAEAIESALAYFFDHRPRRDARRVLAFEGAFHGRMMVALAATWNPAKREPFAWPGYKSVFAPYPDMDGDDITGPQSPDAWGAAWSAVRQADFEEAMSACRRDGDSLLQREIDCLLEVRKQLMDGHIFAILIEPMQCEGGDRYSSARFHQGLAYLATAFDIPLIYDEIQTGFGLGGEFFWHRMFGLREPGGAEFFPAAVICAKKAQVGIFMSNDADRDSTMRSDYAGIIPNQQTCVASLIRGYIQASVVDQFQNMITEIEASNRQWLTDLTVRYAAHIQRPRAKGLSFAFDLATPAMARDFVSHRFQHGLLYYPAGAKTARFRFNLGFRDADMRLFWQQVEKALQATLSEDYTPDSESVSVTLRDTKAYFTFHQECIHQKLNDLRGQVAWNQAGVVDFVEGHLRREWPDLPLKVVLVDANSYSQFRSQILQVQANVYEPARQSSPSEFDALFASNKPLAILVLNEDQIAAMAFAGPLSDFLHQRGVTADPWNADPDVAYMLDLTVNKEFRGRLGSLMKQAITMLAQANGVTAIHGRNRDRLAAGMWAINLSLGSYSTQYLVDDYPDEEPYRNCIYYRCPTVWQAPPIDLSSGIEMPLGIAHLTEDFVRENLPVMVNKLTLSNFVSENFLRQLEHVAKMFPAELRHIYTANGLSECVDKMVKVLWRHRQPRTRLLTVEGGDFGLGSKLARSLSGIGEAFFEVNRLPLPQAANDLEFFEQLQRQLQSDEILGMFIEPLMRRTMTRLDEDVLRGIVDACRNNGVPIIFNETAGLFYRYDERSFAASGIVQPDAAIAYLGGQMGLAMPSDSLFLDEPLLLISTWAGDAFSIAQFAAALDIVESDRSAYFEVVASYQRKLQDLIQERPDANCQLRNGVGTIEGSLPDSLARLFRPARQSRWISCPSYSEMSRFLAAAEGAFV